MESSTIFIYKAFIRVIKWKILNETRKSNIGDFEQTMFTSHNIYSIPVLSTGLREYLGKIIKKGKIWGLRFISF